MSEIDDAVVFKLLQDCDAKEVREALKRRGDALRREERNAALEEAARHVEAKFGGLLASAGVVAEAIRALKEQP